MLGETTCIFRPAENESGKYFAHPDGDHSKTDGNNQERRWILSLRAGREKMGSLGTAGRGSSVWRDSGNTNCFGWSHWHLLFLWVDVSGHTVGHRGWLHLTEGNVRTSPDSHTHSSSSADSPYLKSLSDLLWCLYHSFIYWKNPWSEMLTRLRELLIETWPSRPNSPQRKTHAWCTAEDRDFKIDYLSLLFSKQNLLIYLLVHSLSDSCHTQPQWNPVPQSLSLVTVWKDPLQSSCPDLKYSTLWLGTGISVDQSEIKQRCIIAFLFSLYKKYMVYLLVPLRTELRCRLNGSYLQPYRIPQEPIQC